MDFYQWLFRQNGFRVSNTGYFVYCNGRTAQESFDGKLEFDIKVIPYVGNTDWVEGTIKDIWNCLNEETIPQASPDCEYCRYRQLTHKFD